MTLQELEKRIVMLEALISTLRDLWALHGIKDAKILLDKTENDIKTELGKEL